MNALCFARVRVNYDVADDCVGDERHAPRARRSRERRSGATVVRLRRASSIAMAAVMTPRPRIRRALMNRLGQDGAAAYDDAPQRVVHLIDRLFQNNLAAGEI